MRFNAYKLIARAVEEGVAYGVNRAFKHTDNPSVETLRDNIEREVMNALCDILDFESPPGEKAGEVPYSY